MSVRPEDLFDDIPRAARAARWYGDWPYTVTYHDSQQVQRRAVDYIKSTTRKKGDDRYFSRAYSFTSSS